MARKPLSDERRQELRDQLARGRELRAQRLAVAKDAEADTDWMDEAKANLAAAQEPSPDFIKTPEFQAAVATAVAAALDSKTFEIEERIRAQRNVLGDAPHGDDPGFARVLAAQLAELIDQDRTRRGQAARLPADEIEERRNAAARMEELLLEAYTEQKDPKYAVMKPCYFEEQLIDPTWQNSGTKVLMRREIVWYGVPNEKLAPVNAAAEAIHAAFLRSVGGETRQINRPDLGRPKLRVVGSSDVEGPPVGQPKQIGMLKVLGDTVQGQITETRVVGTIASPARQLA